MLNICSIFLFQMLTYWRQNDKIERENRKKAEKAALEKRRQEEELREAKRQQRKFNFLITQTELYAHFMHNKQIAGLVIRARLIFLTTKQCTQHDFDRGSVRESRRYSQQDGRRRSKWS